MDELKDLIAANLDVVEFLDILGWELSDLLDIPEVEEQIEEHRQKLERAVR